MKHVSELVGRANSYLFAVALREDSSVAMEWVWLADQLTDEFERKYCLKRARQIDPSVTAADDPVEVVRAVKNLIDHFMKPSASFPEQAEDQLATTL